MWPEVFQCPVAHEAPLQALPPSRATGRELPSPANPGLSYAQERPVCPYGQLLGFAGA